jgi:hypothetical protein
MSMKRGPEKNGHGVSAGNFREARYGALGGSGGRSHSYIAPHWATVQQGSRTYLFDRLTPVDA